MISNKTADNQEPSGFLDTSRDGNLPRNRRHLEDVTTTKIQARIIYVVTTWNGVNVIITEPMLAIAETPPYWTVEMVDPDITYGAPSGGAPVPPGHFVDGDAGWAPRIDLP